MPLAAISKVRMATHGDTVERLEMLALNLVEERCAITSPLRGGRSFQAAGAGNSGRGEQASTLAPPSRNRRRYACRFRPPLKGEVTERQAAVLDELANAIAPALDSSGAREIAAILDALSGKFVAPGPSGAPTRGRADCLPTGRNFYSVDVRAVPTPAAFDLGRRSADLLAERYFQDEGEWPRAIALTVWGTSNMRTGGDDIAQALALIGARPVWEGASGRVTGVEVVPLSELKRPRIDVTLRISGFFRDAFPTQIALFHEAVQAVAERDEPDDANPIAARIRADAKKLAAAGMTRGGSEERRVVPRLRLEARRLRRGPAGADRRGHLGGAERPRRGIPRMVGLRLWRRRRKGRARALFWRRG